MTAPSFVAYLLDRVGSNWVIARRTARIVQRYGPDVVCLSPARYAALELDYERETGLAAHGLPGEPARSITAAAPAMLAALRRLCEAHARPCFQGDPYTYAPEWADALAVIAKAEGRTLP